MASPRDAIVIDDEDDVQVSTDFQRTRSPSTCSSASSHTMRAQSPELEVLTMQQLSMEPSATAQCPYSLSSEGANRGNRRRSREFNDQNGRRQRARLSSYDRAGRTLIDLDAEEDDSAGIYNEENHNHEVIDIEKLEREVEEEIFGESQSPRGRNFEGLSVGPRNSLLVPPFVEVDDYKWHEVFLKAGKTVELRNGSFLTIKTVIQNVQTDEVKLRGWQLRRAREVEGLHKKLNEIVFIFEVTLDDQQTCLEQNVIEVAVNDILRIRKLICTNRSFPDCRWDPDYVQGKTRKEQIEYVEKHEVLVARWKSITNFDTERDRLQNLKQPNKYRQRRLERLSEDECTSSYSIPAESLRFLYRGDTVLGGSGIQKSESGPNGQAGRAGSRKSTYIISDDLDGLEKENGNIRRQDCLVANEKQVFTCGDTFSGGGGSMRGADMAGLQLKFGTDICPFCCETLRRNFPDTDIYEMLVDEFATKLDPRGRLLVDVLHCSCPCQPYSPAHPCKGRGKNDEKNTAALFSVSALLLKTRPRIVTSEQTFGILHVHSRLYFSSFISMLTDAGFSVCWQVVKFQDFGLPQSRQRLIIVAAAPGETLPDFPSYTHNEHGTTGLKKWTSAGSILNSIPRNASQNDRALTSKVGINAKPLDALSIIPCITTHGGAYCHPNGLRGFTYRELAALQGFPHKHFFTGNSASVIKRQIGNAVPPSFAKILFKHIREHLERVDGAEKGRRRGH